jgi:hypothetical protein
LNRYLDKDTLEGIRKICELAGGKKITEIIETEIKEIINEKINPNFNEIIEKWNKYSEIKTVGESINRRNIYLSGINKGVHYQFKIRNSKTISVLLGCFTKQYSNFDKTLKSFENIEINGHIFIYPPLTNKEKNNGWKGKIKTDISIMEIDDIINTMEKLIERTKDVLINECK